MRTYFYPIASVKKVAEGGSLTQKDVKNIAKRRKIACETGPSPYVGHFSVFVKTEDKRKITAFLNELF